MRTALRLFAALFVLAPAAHAAAWLKQYPPEGYSEIWHVRLKVKDLDRVIPDIIKTLEKNGGESTIPLKNTVASKLHGYQQLSFRFPKRAAERAVRRLKKFGELDNQPATPTSAADAQAGAEIDDKLKKLEAETAANRDALAKMPAVSAAAAELIEHLTAAKKNRADAKDRVLVNFEISEEAAPATR